MYNRSSSERYTTKIVYFKFSPYDYKNMTVVKDNELKNIIAYKSNPIRNNMKFYSSCWDIIIKKWLRENKYQTYYINMLNPRNPDYYMAENGYVIKVGSTKYTDRLNCFLSNKATLVDCAGNLDIFPETHLISSISNISALADLISQKKWILKLEDGSSAKDVHIINTVDDFNIIKNPINCNKRWVLQEYICNPMLLFGKYKFHLRSHTIILNGKIHVFNSCDVLAATHVYNNDDFTDIKSHITNVAVNKFSENHRTYISNEFPEIHCLMSEVYKLIEKSFVLPKKEYKQIKYDGWNLFGILAHDILVDENGRLYLLEINNSPGMYKLEQMTERYEANIKKFVSGMFNIFISGADQSFITLSKRLPKNYLNYTWRNF